MIGVMKRIIAESTGGTLESNLVPMLEFMGPDMIKVHTVYVCVCCGETGGRLICVCLIGQSRCRQAAVKKD